MKITSVPMGKRDFTTESRSHGGEVGRIQWARVAHWILPTLAREE